MFKEFKEFAFKGNMVDLAVGIILGTAFAKMIDSLVKHLIMPAISIILPGEKGYLSWKITIASKNINFGLFIGEALSFIIVAITLYIFIVKFMAWVKKAKKEELKQDTSEQNKQEKLLTEIRDIIASQS